MAESDSSLRITPPAEPALTFATEDVPLDPIAFTIDGETFYARAWMTGAQFLRYSKMLNQGGLITTVMVDDFFAESLDAAEHERFRKFIEDPDRRVTTKLLADIFNALFARYAAGGQEESRPTEPSKP